jgi:hypothetical protein
MRRIAFQMRGKRDPVDLVDRMGEIRYDREG